MEYGTERLVERVALHFEAEGMPRIAGRILGFLLLCREPRSLDELAGALRISKGSASSNARLLERLGVVERSSVPGDRRDYYGVAGDLHTRLLELWLERLARTHRLVAEALEAPCAMDPQVRERLDLVSSFVAHMVAEVEATREQWLERAKEAMARRDAGAGE